MNRCPYCFTPSAPDRVAFMCQGDCPTEVDTETTRQLGFSVNGRRVTTAYVGAAGRPATVACDGCRKPTQAMVCPACHLQLPSGWLDHQTVSVVMTGAKASGKSVYVAVAVQQLTLLVEHLGGVCLPFNSSTKRLYEENYLGPLRNGQVLETTRAANPTEGRLLPAPLVFEIVVGGVRQLLVVRDVPGENLEDSAFNPALLSFASRADALLFLVDPLRIQEIKHITRGSLPEPEALGEDPMSVLNNISRLLGAQTGGGRHPIPIGLVLSKFDVLQEMRKAEHPVWAPVMRNRGAAFQRDPSMKTLAFDPSDATLLSEEINAMLAKLNARGLLNLLDNTFSHVRVFAVSALGHHTYGDRLHTSGIAPFRVLDPLKWAMDGARW